MAPVTPPAHHPTRPPVVSQQEAGQDRRARWWAGRGRGHCGREFATGCCLDARDRRKTHSTRRQHKGGGKGGGEQAKPNRGPPKTATEQKTRERESKHRRKKPNTQAIWPYGRRNTQPNNKNTGKHPGGKGHAMSRKSMLRSNASEMIMKSSVVPKQKPGKQKNTEKNSQQQQSSKSVNSRKRTSRVTACAPTPKTEGKR